MKTTNKTRSKIFKAAWTIFKENSGLISFSEALISAWKWAKKTLVEKRVSFLGAKKETEKALLIIIKSYYCHVREEYVDYTIWAPKSIIVGNTIPEWFYEKNV